MRRVELADAALKIIATRGIVELTTRNLAAEVGLTTGAIFRHFASLPALLVAVAERVEAILATSYPPAGLAPRARLAHFIDARSAVVGTHAGVLRLMLSDQFSLALPAPAVRRLRAARATTQAFLVETLTAAQAAGEVRRDVGPEALTVVVMGTIQMLALSLDHTPRARRAAHTAAVRTALAQLLAPPPTARTSAAHRARTQHPHKEPAMSPARFERRPATLSTQASGQVRP